MKVLITDIPDEGLDLEIKDKPEIENVNITSPAVAALHLEKSGGEVIVSGELNAQVHYQCCRCLKDFEREETISINVVYHPVTDMTNDRHELHDDEMDMGFYSGVELDLGDLVGEQLFLNISMKPLCSEDCKGLCAICGVDLNDVECGCKKADIDPRLEALRKIFEKGRD